MFFVRDEVVGKCGIYAAMKSNTRLVKIGCSGFRSSRDSYYPLLRAVEVQHTFYQPPQVKTLEKWRAGTPEGFEFAVKAWQLITHQSSSPTYRRLKRELSEEEKEGAGSFRPSKIVKEAWEVTRACAAALDAKMVLFQCPAISSRECQRRKPAKVLQESKRDWLIYAGSRAGVPRGSSKICAPTDCGTCRPFLGQDVTPGVLFPLHCARVRTFTKTASWKSLLDAAEGGE